MAMNSVFTILAFSGVLWSISPRAFRHLRCLCRARLVSDDQARPAARPAEQRPTRPRGELPLRTHSCSRECRRRHVWTQKRATRPHGLRSASIDSPRISGASLRSTATSGFFSTGYNWLIQIIPILIIAPAFMRGEVEFGVITQSAIAFTTLVAAFSLVVTQFQSLSTYAEVVSRLGSLVDAFESEPPASAPGIGMVEAAGRLAFENGDPAGARSRRLSLRDLSVEVPKRNRTLIAGSNPTAGRALFRATAGAQFGIRPDHPPAGEQDRLSAATALHASGSLRQIFLDGQTDPPGDERIVEVLRLLGFDTLLPPDRKLDREQDLGARLCSREQQLLAFARVSSRRRSSCFSIGFAPCLGRIRHGACSTCLRRSGSPSFMTASRVTRASFTTLFSTVGRMEAGRGPKRAARVTPDGAAP